MKKPWLIMLLTVLPVLAGFAGGQKEEALPDAPSTPIEVKKFAGDEGETGAVSKESEDESLELSVDKAVDIAVARNLDLKSREIDVRIKERQADYAWNEFIPTAQASTTLSRMNAEQDQEIPIGTLGGAPGTLEPLVTTEQEFPQWSVAAGLDFSLSLNVALGKGIQATRKAWRAERISYKQAEAQLEKDVRKSFYNLLLMQEQRKLQVEQIETAKERYEQAQINYENGLVPELSVLNAQVAYENLKPALDAMDLGYRQALQGFKMNLGLDLDREVELTGSIETDPVRLEAEELIEKHLADRYDIRSLIANIQTLEDQYTANRLRAFTPTLSLGLNFDPTFQRDPWADPWFDDISEDWKQRSGMFRMTIAMSLDGFLPFSKTQVGLREMEDNIAKMRVGMQQAIRGAEMEIENTIDQIEKSQDTIDTLQLNVDRAQRAYEMAEEAYRVGSKELLEVKDAQDELQKAKLEVLKEQYNYITAILDLEYAINEDIEAVAGE